MTYRYWTVYRLTNEQPSQQQTYTYRILFAIIGKEHNIPSLYHSVPIDSGIHFPSTFFFVLRSDYKFYLRIVYYDNKLQMLGSSYCIVLNNL